MAEGGFDFNKLMMQMGVGMGGGQAGGEGTMLDDIGNKMAGLLSKLTGFLPNLSNPQNAGLKSLDAAQGLQDKMINQSKGLSLKRDNAIIGNEIAKRFVREATGVHSAEQEAIKISAINIEPLPVGEARFAHADVPHMPDGGFRPSGGPGMSASIEMAV